MSENNVEDTNKTIIENGDAETTEKTIKNKRKGLWILGGIIFVILTMSLGAFIGYSTGIQNRLKNQNSQVAITATTQFQLGLEDLNAGRYEMARKRFEYVIQIDPTFPNATEMLSEAMLKLAMIETPTVFVEPTITVTPTPDLRGVEELYNQAQMFLRNGDWNGAIVTIEALRKEDLSYRAVEVDGIYYIALRHRGVDKILQEGNLEGGIYDLTLVERFGPLDKEADGFRNWARLYLTGTSFWEIDWPQVVYYFGQVASALPNLMDGGHWTASERYRVSLIKYGDQLIAEGNYCGGRDQYQLALSFSQDANLVPTATAAQLLCAPPTSTPVPSTPTPETTATADGGGVVETPVSP